MNKQIIDQYFNKNYIKLREVAINILNNSNNYRIKLDGYLQADELISIAYEYLVKNNISENIEAVIINYIKKQLVWTNTTFINNNVKQGEEITDFLKTKIELIEDDSSLNDEFEFKHQNDINIITIIYYNHLNKEEQILYDLRYKQELPYRAIAKKVNIPYTPLFHMAKQLHNKIKKLYNEYTLINE